MVSKDPKVAGIGQGRIPIEAWLADAGHDPAPVPPTYNTSCTIVLTESFGNWVCSHFSFF